MRNILLLVNVLIWASASVADICSHLPGYTKYSTSCFKLYIPPRNWAAAEASCVADGGHLASIHSSDEQAFISNYLNGAGPSNIWIGLRGIPSNMAWSDNTNMYYTAWDGPDPDASSERCAIMKSTQSFFWEDRLCTSSNSYLCKADASGTVANQTQAFFTKIPDGVPVDSTVVHSSSQMVHSTIECALRCLQDAQCVHFIMSEAGGNYFCEIYSSLERPPTATPPTDNYLKIEIV